jgi:hypothetical protein
MAHGMEASLVGLMGDAMQDVPFAAATAETDFERETERSIEAGDWLYRFQFSRDLSFQAAMETKPFHFPWRTATS